MVRIPGVRCLWYVLLPVLWLLAVPGHLSGQGFDWQYSARLPTSYPTFFIGVTGSGSFNSFDGDITYLQGVVLCGTFNRGDGSGFSGGVQAEQWLDASWALNASLRYETMGGLFSSTGDTLARGPNAQPTVIAYEIESDFSYASIDLGARYRPFRTSKVFLGFGVQAGVLLSSSTLQRQRIVSPPEQRFADGSQEQSLNDNIVGFSSLYLGGRMSAGIDVPLANSLYASPAVYAAIPLTSMAKDARWQRLTVGVQISILYGIMSDGR